MRISDFDLYRDLLKKQSGQILTPDKSYLLDSRLTPVARSWGYPSLAGMTLALRAVPDPKLVSDVVEAMANSETSFFRDPRTFEMFAGTALPYFSKARKKRRSLRLWCAGCASGQEAYSLAITVLENQKYVPGWAVEIYATDISSRALAEGQLGAYSQFDVQRGLPADMLLKYFKQEGDRWRLVPEAGKMVKFASVNLLHDLDRLGEFDAIFCRNVMTDFDDETRNATLARLTTQLAPDGFLFMGSADSPAQTPGLRLMDSGAALYILKESPHDKQGLPEAAAR